MAPVLSDTLRAATRAASASGIRFRRAVVLMLMTLVLPGSAQLVAGRKEIGRIAMRIWFGLIVTALLLFLLGLVSARFVFWLSATPSCSALSGSC